MRETRRRTPLYDWIATLRKRGLKPNLHVLEWCETDWQSRERYWIASLRTVTPLLNLAEGGDEPLCSPEVRSQNGKKVAKAIHSDPERRQIWAAKRALGQALKQGILREETKEKMREAARLRPDLFGSWASI